MNVNVGTPPKEIYRLQTQLPSLFIIFMYRTHKHDLNNKCVDHFS